MTVQELIDRLEKAEDKSKIIQIPRMYDYYGYTQVIEEIKEDDDYFYIGNID